MWTRLFSGGENWVVFPLAIAIRSTAFGCISLKEDLFLERIFIDETLAAGLF